jgi:hypothetical protein
MILVNRTTADLLPQEQMNKYIAVKKKIARTIWDSINHIRLPKEVLLPD